MLKYKTKKQDRPETEHKTTLPFVLKQAHMFCDAVY